ncbi:hypothetical protein PV328_006083 [Microctonus aethiopoides]|uniref:Uncharacterized protein n=1 Tax=Microctonus aethiopoides TaxID=144406 RepID=A0AA39KT57_9HYME|nr:hypothetical protein PV328_006083 [Microctonus aethiopoides]
MKKKYSLIYWIASKDIQIIATTKIPSHSRYEDATVKLKWQDTQTKQSVNLDAKIVKMSDEKEELEKICVDENTGMILDGAIKAFSQKIHTIKSNLKKEKTETEKRKHNMKMKQEKELSDSQSILRTSCTNQHDKFANKTLTMRKPKILMDVPVQFFSGSQYDRSRELIITVTAIDDSGALLGLTVAGTAWT